MLLLGHVKSCNILDPRKPFEVTEHLPHTNFIVYRSIPTIAMEDY